MKNTFRYILLTGAILLSVAACNPGRDNGVDATTDTTLTDTTLMDTPMSTGAGSDTLRDSINEGVDGTGKPNTDPRTRKQQ